MENNKKSLKIVFFGSSAFSKDVLHLLLDTYKLNIIGVVTKKDAVVGRKKELAENIVKIEAKAHNIPVLDDPKGSETFLKDLEANLCITASYGVIIKKNLLEIPLYGFLNVHGSLLPHLRGAIPIQMSIFNGDKETGTTIIKMDPGMDTGDMLVKEAVSISPEDTFGSLAQKLAEVGARILSTNLDAYVDGTLPLARQREKEATYCYIKDIDMIKHVSTDLAADQVECAVRALAPNDYPEMQFDGQEILLYKVYAHDAIDMAPKKIGESVSYKKDGERHIFVKCREGFLELVSIKPKGKNIMKAADYWNGYMKG